MGWLLPGQALFAASLPVDTVAAGSWTAPAAIGARRSSYAPSNGRSAQLPWSADRRSQERTPSGSPNIVIDAITGAAALAGLPHAVFVGYVVTDEDGQPTGERWMLHQGTHGTTFVCATRADLPQHVGGMQFESRRGVHHGTQRVVENIPGLGRLTIMQCKSAGFAFEQRAREALHQSFGFLQPGLWRCRQVEAFDWAAEGVTDRAAMLASDRARGVCRTGGRPYRSAGRLRSPGLRPMHLAGWRGRR